MDLLANPIHCSDSTCLNILSKCSYFSPQQGSELFIGRKRFSAISYPTKSSTCAKWVITSSKRALVFRLLSLLQNISDESVIPLWIKVLGTVGLGDSLTGKSEPCQCWIPGSLSMIIANIAWIRVWLTVIHPTHIPQLLGVRILAGNRTEILLALRNLQTGQEERLQKLI